jgi:hypothetical protein
MKPTLGRIVHFVSNGNIVRAGIISDVEKKQSLPDHQKWDGEENGYTVSLHVLNPWGMEIERNVPFDNSGPDKELVGRTWFWPPRE